MDILVQNARVLTMATRQEIEDGCVAVKDGVITYVGARSGYTGGPARRVIDAKGGVVMPGFINGHTHMAMTLLRGYGGDMNLQDWLFNMIFPAEDRLVPGDCGPATQLAIAESLLGGATAFLDMYMFMDEVAEATRETGMRAVLTRGLTAGELFAQKLVEGKRLCAQKGLITGMMCIHAEYTNDEDTVRQVVQAARELGVGIHVHVSETHSEVQGCVQRHGVSPVKWLNSLGVFRGHTVAAHTVWVDDEDMAILRENGVYCVHNPSSNMKLSSGIMPAQRMLNAGIPLAIGTDGASSGNNLNMLREMRIAALLGKLERSEPTDMDAWTVLEMATIGGARALNIADVCGTLEVGKQADLIMFDTSKPWWTPKQDAATQIAYAASQEDIVLAMVNGRILMENRALTTIDLERVQAQAQQSVKHLY